MNLLQDKTNRFGARAVQRVTTRRLVIKPCSLSICQNLTTEVNFESFDVPMEINPKLYYLFENEGKKGAWLLDSTQILGPSSELFFPPSCPFLVV